MERKEQESCDTAAPMDLPSEVVYPPVEEKGEAVPKMEIKIIIPTNRFKAFKKEWNDLYAVVANQLKIQVKVDIRARLVHIRTCDQTVEPSALQKASDFLNAYCVGFSMQDALSLVRMDDIYMESFEIKDVRTLTGDNLSRAIGRIVGKDGKIKFAIENMSRTRIVVAEQKIHILGTFSNIRVSRNAIVSLIRGSTPGKVYGKLRIISSRIKERM